MAKIYVIGLGEGEEENLTLAAVKRIHSRKANFILREDYPILKYFKDENIEYKTIEKLLNEFNANKEVKIETHEILIKEALKRGEINCYISGYPKKTDSTIKKLLESDCEIKIIPAISHIDYVINMIDRDKNDSLKILNATVFNRNVIDINSDMILIDVDKLKEINNIKEALALVYGEDYTISLINYSKSYADATIVEIPTLSLDEACETMDISMIYVKKIIKKSKKVFDFNDLSNIMEILRGKNGCPWDREQNHSTLRGAVIEESYELVHAIDNNSPKEVVEELGDVLLQVIFHSQIGFENGEFSSFDVTSAISNKLISRHPHVFSEKSIENSEEVVYNWDEIKYGMRGLETLTARLKDVKGLTALLTALKIQEKASKVGFDWENSEGAMEKIIEEVREFKLAESAQEMEAEFGDILFSIVNFARFFNINPEVALMRTCKKFIHRIELMENELLNQGKSFADCSLEELDTLWDNAKMLEANM